MSFLSRADIPRRHPAELMRVFRIVSRPSLAGRKSYHHHLCCIGQPRPSSTPKIPVAFFPSFAPTPSLRLYSKKSIKRPPTMTTTATTLKGQPLDRATLDAMLRRRMFYTPSFEVCINMLPLIPSLVPLVYILRKLSMNAYRSTAAFLASTIMALRVALSSKVSLTLGENISSSRKTCSRSTAVF